MPDDLDPECRSLCDALNRLPGIQTIESCCGHGERPFLIFFIADSLESLPAALYYFDVCHCGFGGWRVVAITDCGMNPVKFMVEGPIGAYDQAADIAERINKYVSECETSNRDSA